MSIPTAPHHHIDPFDLPEHDAALADLRGRIDGDGQQRRCQYS
jgi:hypothetical protein